MIRALNKQIKEAFLQSRCFAFVADPIIVEGLRAGQDPELHLAGLQAVRDAMILEAAGGDEAVARRLRNDSRLGTRLVVAMQLVHLALARGRFGTLHSRRFVLVRERPGWRAISMTPPSISHVGKGPRTREMPSVYVGLNVFDVLSDERRTGKLERFEAFLELMGVEERAIETGYEHVEKVAPEVESRILALEAAVLGLPMPRPEQAIGLADRRKPGPFTDSLRVRYARRLDARMAGDPSRLDHGECEKAIRALERLARRHKREGDQESLGQVMKLLVASSGHDHHGVRNRANVMIERILAPRPFDAPLARLFVNVRRGNPHRFAFTLEKGNRAFLRLYRNTFAGEFPTEAEIDCEDIELERDPVSGQWVAERVFETIGAVDFAVMRRGRKHARWVDDEGTSGRVNVVADVRGDIILEIFTDIHGHTRMWWGDGTDHPGLVYNENGEVIRLGRFSDVAAHLPDLIDRYGITAIYLLGVQKRGSNREDWAPEARSPSPFSPMSLTQIEPALGGEDELEKLIERAHDLDLRVIVDVVPHLNRRSTELSERCIVSCLDGSGGLVQRASTDGRFGSWNDGKLPNWRCIDVWRWMRDSIVKLVADYGVDGIRFDIAHAVPIMMKRENAPVIAGVKRTHEQMLEGTVVSNEMSGDRLVTTGYYDSACRDAIAVPLHHMIQQAVERKLRELGRESFVNIAECYWGHERFLARSGILPYNSALFKICESISHGKSDVSEIYRLYEDYYASVLPRGTTMVGILGNHDERRALNIFGVRGLRPAVALTVFLSDIVMDYEGSAEGEGWKVFLDNIHVNWNQFESAAHRSLERFYARWYGFHRTSEGRSSLVCTDNPMVAAAMKVCTDGIWVGVFNFSDENQAVGLSFEGSELPLDDDEWYRLADAVYSPVTRRSDYYTGRELRTSLVNTVVSYTDRVKLLKLERLDDHDDFMSDMLRGSFYRMCEIEDPERFGSSFAFEQLAVHASSYDELASYIESTILPSFGPDESTYVELGLKRAMFHLTRQGRAEATRLLEWIGRMAREGGASLEPLGAKLEYHNRPGPMVFLSAEAEPFSKSGGLANVVYELPREMASMGEDVTVVTPLYRQGNDKAVTKMRSALARHGVTYTDRNVHFKILDQSYEVGVHEGRVDGIRYLMLDHHEFFDGLYWGYTAAEKLRRRVAFSRGCIEVLHQFAIHPKFTFTNDAFAGLFNGLARSDPHYASSPVFAGNTFLHIIHNGGWQYFDTYFRWEGGGDLFSLFNLPEGSAEQFTDPVRPECINSMAGSIRFADRVFTVSPSYARQIKLTCDGLETLLHDVVGISNAVGSDLRPRLQRSFDESGFVEAMVPQLRRAFDRDADLASKVRPRWPELLDGGRECDRIEDPRRRAETTRVRNKMMLQLERGLTPDPARPLFTMIHRITEQKGFSLLLEASEGIVRTLGYTGIIGGAFSSGDHIGENLAGGLTNLARFYPESISFTQGYQDVSIPLLCSDVFLMPSMSEPGGISQLEAFACGCLVVARATGGLRDTISPIKVEDGHVTGNGFLFVDFDSSSFYDAMARCAQFFRTATPEQLAQARANAEAAAYHWDRPANRYIESVYGMREVIRI